MSVGGMRSREGRIYDRAFSFPRSTLCSTSLHSLLFHFPPTFVCAPLHDSRQIYAYYRDPALPYCQVDEFIFDYTACKNGGAPPANVDAWSYDAASKECSVSFTLPKTFKAPVFLYYRLTNFYQNHRRYVKSMSSGQLNGEALSANDLSSDCSPLVTNDDGLVYYPCGLIANSMFNGRSCYGDIRRHVLGYA